MPRKTRKPPIMFTGENQIWLFVAKHRAYLPWKFSDAVQTPQWQAFIADAIAKKPDQRSADEKRAIEIELAADGITPGKGF